MTDLKNKQAHMRGQTQWVDGHGIPVSAEGYAYNVPATIARKLLANGDVWELPKGAPPPAPAKNAPVLGRPGGAALAAVQVRTVETVLTPRALAYLESLPLDVLSLLASRMEVDLGHVEPSVQRVARAVIGASDEQLAFQLQQAVKQVLGQAEADEDAEDDEDAAEGDGEGEKSDVPEESEDDDEDAPEAGAAPDDVGVVDEPPPPAAEPTAKVVSTTVPAKPAKPLTAAQKKAAKKAAKAAKAAKGAPGEPLVNEHPPESSIED
jgi:hypothetical protein